MKRKNNNNSKISEDVMFVGKLEDLTVDFNKIKDYDLLMFPLDIWQEMTIYNKELQDKITKKYNDAMNRCPDVYAQFCEMVECGHITFSEIHRLVNTKRKHVEVLVECLKDLNFIKPDQTGFVVLEKQKLKDFLNPKIFKMVDVLAYNQPNLPVVATVTEAEYNKLAMCIDDGEISVSLLQRILCVGYSRALNTIEDLIGLGEVERVGYKYNILDAEGAKFYFAKRLNSEKRMDYLKGLSTSIKELSNEPSVESVSKEEFEKLQKEIDNKCLSTDILQNVFQIGYLRAVNTIKKLEKLGVMEVSENGCQILDIEKTKEFFKQKIKEWCYGCF